MVEQRDRDAAADHGRAIHYFTFQEAVNVRKGKMDEHPMVQAFARHREAERQAIVDWLRAGAGQNTQNMTKPIKALFLRGLHSYADAIASGAHLSQ